MAKTPFIEKLFLTQFRSYPNLAAQFDGRPVVLFGENGAGKTNLLEAVSLLSPGRGLRRAKLGDIARRENDTTSHHWAVSAVLTGASDDLLEPVKIGTGQIPDAPTRRQIRIDGKNASGTDLATHLTVNWLTPAQDRLFSGAPADRRKFFDRLCLVHAPAHGRAHLVYDKARAERGRLFADNIDDAYWFDALETDMAENAAKIAKARWQTLCKLQAEIEDSAEDSFPKAVISLDGEAEALYQSGAEETDVYGFIKAQLQKDRALDKSAGRTLRGVHKSDLCVVHRSKNMPAAECSTGEQKALLIGLILAHARAQPLRTPILLLDEIAAHLDENRRAALTENLLALGTQVFMTGTDKSLFSAFKDRAQMFKVEDAALTPQ